MSKLGSNIKEIFSGPYGFLSSKRILGAIVLMSCLVFIIYQSIQEGITDNIKELFEWLIITSSTLLGITSITNVFKNNKNT
jgi:hypothetical protein